MQKIIIKIVLLSVVVPALSSPWLSFSMDILHAIKCNKIEQVRKIISDENFDINKTYEDISLCFTPLYCACKYGKIEILRELLKHPKIDVNKANESGPDEGGTPLCVACSQPYDAKIPEQLLKHKDIDVSKAGKNGRTALWSVRHLTVRDLLLQKNIDLNKVDNFNKTILYYACEKTCFYYIKLLLEKGARVDEKSIEIVKENIDKENSDHEKMVSDLPLLHLKLLYYLGLFHRPRVNPNHALILEYLNLAKEYDAAPGKMDFDKLRAENKPAYDLLVKRSCVTSFEIKNMFNNLKKHIFSKENRYKKFQDCNIHIAT